MSTVVGGMDISMYCAENDFGKISLFMGIWKVCYQSSHINVIGLQSMKNQEWIVLSMLLYF